MFSLCKFTLASPQVIASCKNSGTFLDLTYAGTESYQSADRLPLQL